MPRCALASFVIFACSLAACAHASDGEGASTGAAATSVSSDEGANCVIAKFQEDPAAPKLCAAQCDGGDAESCSTLGAMYEQGHLVGAPDAAKAKAAYSRGCDGGDRLGCSALGNLTRESDPKTALAAFERVCKSKEDKDAHKDIGEACAFVGTAYAEGTLVPKDVKRATDDLSRACEMGHIASCDKLDFKPKR